MFAARAARATVAQRTCVQLAARSPAAIATPAAARLRVTQLATPTAVRALSASPTDPKLAGWREDGREGGMERRVKSWERRYGGATNFPDYIDHWTPDVFRKVGYGLGGMSLATLLAMGPLSLATVGMAVVTGSYWAIGINDMRQQTHSIRRNFPFLGNVRYIFETLRPEIRQYFIEADGEASPFNRSSRSVVYQRAKKMVDTLPMGTRRNVYEEGYEWANHSMWPREVPKSKERVLIGGPDCEQPYSASLLNISAMSYGALSDNAILALNGGAALGGFYHNTGEGGISRFHLEPGGDIVWNVGTGYFGCRNPDGTFNPDMFKENAARPQVKMIELKLSQGAKPGHGGILPFAKLTPAIAEARGIDLKTWGTKDVDSPPSHKAFKGPHTMMLFIQQLRELSGGKPIGFKMCVGDPTEIAAVVHAMVDLDIYPDFITVDGGEGGTGAAPPEFSNSIGTPLVEGLYLVNSLLEGAAIREKIKIIVAGKVLSGFSLVRCLALGADVCNAARAMMFALGCVQALKCNTNKCPTGVATQEPHLMQGLVVEDKARRVANYQQQTIKSAMEIVGAMGLTDPQDLEPSHIQRRMKGIHVTSYAETYPPVERGSLLYGTGPENLQVIWDSAKEFHSTDKRGNVGLTCGVVDLGVSTAGP